MIGLTVSAGPSAATASTSSPASTSASSPPSLMVLRVVTLVALLVRGVGILSLLLFACEFLLVVDLFVGRFVPSNLFVLFRRLF